MYDTHTHILLFSNARGNPQQLLITDPCTCLVKSICIYGKFAANSSMWGSLTLTPNISICHDINGFDMVRHGSQAISIRAENHLFIQELSS